MKHSGGNEALMVRKLPFEFLGRLVQSFKASVEPEISEVYLGIMDEFISNMILRFTFQEFKIPHLAEIFSFMATLYCSVPLLALKVNNKLINSTGARVKMRPIITYTTGSGTAGDLQTTTTKRFSFPT